MEEITARGYTGHEHLNQFQLINMNGRLYDPVTRQMSQPDILNSDPYSTQSYNRYAYVKNNPLKYTDPSGYVDVGHRSSSDENAIRTLFCETANNMSMDFCMRMQAMADGMFTDLYNASRAGSIPYCGPTYNFGGVAVILTPAEKAVEGGEEVPAVEVELNIKFGYGSEAYLNIFGFGATSKVTPLAINYMTFNFNSDNGFTYTPYKSFYSAYQVGFAMFNVGATSDYVSDKFTPQLNIGLVEFGNQIRYTPISFGYFEGVGFDFRVSFNLNMLMQGQIELHNAFMNNLGYHPGIN